MFREQINCVKFCIVVDLQHEDSATALLDRICEALQEDAEWHNVASVEGYSLR